MNGIKIEEVPLKKCSKCGEEKTLSEFYKHSIEKDGLSSPCKDCCKLYLKKWRKNNHEKVKEISTKYYALKKDEIKTRLREYYKLHKEKVLEATHKQHMKNPDKIRASWKRSNDKKSSTLKGKLSYRMRNRINKYLRKGRKANRHWETLVGFTIAQLKEHLEKQFTEGMTWEKFMKGEIHIDHKIPLAVHNYESPDDIDFKKAWALSNLQPLWAGDNIKKGIKLPERSI